jgi:redox-sensitive bicupin YhaK (pirin superfamily)
MAYRIVKPSEQADGGFNGGEIVEKKPIGFPQDGGTIKPYSNLFYWAHGWSEKGSTIGLHPHQGFEILTFVLTGSMEHYDTGIDRWKKLDTGAVQIIRSGSGISHSEKVNRASSFFQIWFDPDLRKTINTPATYDDYPAGTFSWVNRNGHREMVYTSGGNPIEMTSEEVEIFRWEALSAGTHRMDTVNRTLSVFVLDGSVRINGHGAAGTAGGEDFIIVSDQAEWVFGAAAGTSLFIVKTPARPSYQNNSYFARS